MRHEKNEMHNNIESKECTLVTSIDLICSDICHPAATTLLDTLSVISYMNPGSLHEHGTMATWALLRREVEHT